MIKFDELIQLIPYIGLFAGKTRKEDEGRGRPLITRLIESSLPGIFVALVYMYTIGQSNSMQIVELKTQIAKIETQQLELIKLVSELKARSK